MHLAPKINRRIDKLRTLLQGSVPLEIVVFQVQQTLKPWGVNIYITDDDNLARSECAASGIYDCTKKRRPIEIMLYFNPRVRRYKFTNKTWADFRFLLSNVLQHELIHKEQYLHRPVAGNATCLYYDVKAGEKSNKEYMDYLAELDEIDAYAHDIAMEIKEYYPTIDPYEVLATINQRKKLWSWKHYKQTFKDSEDWSDVRNRLLKKTYLWLPQVTV